MVKGVKFQTPDLSMGYRGPITAVSIQSDDPQSVQESECQIQNFLMSWVQALWI